MFAISSPDEFLVKQLLLKNCGVDFVEIWNVCPTKVIITAAKTLIRFVAVIVLSISASLFWNTLYITDSLISCSL